MKKGEKKFTLSNRWLYTLISLGILLLISVGVYAYGTASPSTFGHSAGEIDLSGVSRVVTAEGNTASVYDLSGGNIAASTSIYSYGRICAGMSAGDCTGSGGTLITSGGISTGSISTGQVSSSGSNQGFTKYDGNYGLSVDVGYAGVIAEGDNYGVLGRSYGDGTNLHAGIAVQGQGTKYDFLATGAGTNYGASSSIRWKNNISEIPDALNKILKLRGVYYDWNEEHGGEHDMGFIAEEVGSIVPEIVSYDDKSNSSNWYIDENGNKKLYATGLDYGALTPMLVEAIKEQQKIINSQEEKLNKICTKLPSLCEYE